jgi:hypothetical protein
MNSFFRLFFYLVDRIDVADKTIKQPKIIMIAKSSNFTYSIIFHSNIMGFFCASIGY